MYVSLDLAKVLYRLNAYSPGILIQDCFAAQTISALVNGSSFSWSLCPLIVSLLQIFIFSTLYFLKFPVHPEYFLSLSQNHSFYHVLFLSLENGIRNQDLGVWCVLTVNRVKATSSSQPTEEGKICEYPKLCIHVSIHISLYNYLYVKAKHECSLTSLAVIHHSIDLSGLFPCLVGVGLPPNSEYSSVVSHLNCWHRLTS